MPIRKDDYFCGIFIEKSCQKFANLSQDIAVVRQVHIQISESGYSFAERLYLDSDSDFFAYIWIRIRT